MCVFFYILFEGEEHAIRFALDQMALSKRAFTKYTKNLPDKRFGQCHARGVRGKWSGERVVRKWGKSLMSWIFVFGAD